jgi:ribonuclease E
LAHAGVEATGSPAPVVEAPAYETVQEAAIAESAPAQPLVKPILVGADAEPPAEKKRGWWRR